MVKRFLGIGVVGILAVLAACSSSSATGDCTSLPSCCSQLSDASSKNECMEVVALGDATSCGEAQSDFEGDGLCQVASSSSSSATGCAGLTACCSSLPASEQSGCSAIATTGDDTLCTTELQTYVSSGTCKTVSSSGGTGCSGLSSCCSTLSGAEQTECQDLVTAANGSDSECTMLLASYPSCASGTGTGSGSGSSGGSGCSGLSSCCSSLPSAEQSGCQAIVTEGNDTECTAELMAYQDASECGGSGIGTGTGSGTGTVSASGDCSSLSDCCATLPSDEQAGCNEIVSAGDSSECSTELTAYQDSGSCGGSGTGSGSGSSSGGGGCASLSSCCASLSSAEQPGCNEIVSEGNDSECSTELTAYMEDNLCS